MRTPTADMGTPTAVRRRGMAAGSAAAAMPTASAGVRRSE
jgi:hypothetical protein